MKNYLKYLSENPLKALILLLVIIFVGAYYIYIVRHWDEILEDNSITVIVIVISILTAILPVVFLQSYKEYKGK